MDYEQMPAGWGSREEVKQAVVEQVLFEAFNPFSSLNKPTARAKGEVLTYTVKQGDTLSEIASRYGLSLKQLVELNKMVNPHLLGIGMKLVLNSDEVTHTVRRGENMDYIAKRYNVSKEMILEKNPLLRLMSDNLYIGQSIQIPVADTGTLTAKEWSQKRNVVTAASRKANRSRMMEWPVKDATVTSGFGTRWGRMHKGLDMWKESEGQTPIYAAKEGVVVEAGGNRGGYGYIVILDHGDGLQTYYAHMRKIIVSPGQQVEQGEMLGYMGRTGDSTGYHLHFEVREDNVPMNPLRYLSR
ncbi:M23 family metallopeptidase [Brevibacillus composti]|uniref:M23 family metallopeptidase n=1 Tax=Brevibacillus composti TaxID=2796470 RepID=A0A7T5EKD5_9BACL|nr:M23 family metallopeptidase [Brevibacillus composti]QQE74245.1 M23 family metallopeptidase [Brevibacillus composti]QUO41327.1 M23 family metallopeptidase [Brevibacillus composti]